jgi:hypothetical protein
MNRVKVGGPVPDLSSIITDAAQRHNVSPELMLRIARIESGMNPNSANPNSSARGVYQFLTKPGGSWSKYGQGANPLDPFANVDAGARYIKDNQAALRSKLGREPADWETYFAHQQGAGGAPALLLNPNKPAAEVLRAFYKDPNTARDAVRLNAGNPDAPAADFAALWKAKYEGTPLPKPGQSLDTGPVAFTDPGGVTNPGAINPAMLAAAATAPQSVGLGSIFADIAAPLAKKPVDPNELVRKPKHSVGSMIGDLGKPVELSELG